jgi:hypothetical protein
MHAIDENHYLVATWEGVLKTTKDQTLKHYFAGERANSLCHVSGGSLYLVGFELYKLIVWNEQAD